MTESVWPVRCNWCGAVVFKALRDVNRAEKRGANLYCGRDCSNQARRDPNPPSDAEKRDAKAEYDRQYRRSHSEMLKAKKAKYHRDTYDPLKAAQQRKARMPQHVEYCRQPEYKKWKAQYDRRYRAKKEFGPFAEASLVLNELQAEILSRASRYEIDLASGTLNKKLQRRRDYERQTDRR